MLLGNGDLCSNYAIGHNRPPFWGLGRADCPSTVANPVRLSVSSAALPPPACSESTRHAWRLPFG